MDHDLFVRAVINVLSNAAEHTPREGTVTISITGENGFLSFTIGDTGKGFSPEALKHGTEQFCMDDESRNSKTHFGIGLMLRIQSCKSIMASLFWKIQKKPAAQGLP